ncbi:MAG: sugar-binding protein [Polyangiales bacterium]
MLRNITLWLLIALTVSGCVERRRRLSPEEKSQVEPFLSQKAPSPEHKTEVGFGDKVTLLGYAIDQARWQEGKALKVSWYWKVHSTLDPGWRVFTHIGDEKDDARLNADNYGIIRELYPPELWQPGTTVRDEQTLYLPKGWKAKEAHFFVGFWKGEERLPITKGKGDGKKRAKIFSVPVLPSASAKVAAGEALRVDGPPNIDGKLDEAAWRQAASLGKLVDPLTGDKSKVKASVKALWDREKLYLAFDVRDRWLETPYDKRDDHLWKKDAVEVMIDADGSGAHYLELQVSPKGVIFDTRYKTPREPKPYGKVNWSAEAEAAVVVDGSIGDGKSDKGYRVEIAIPWLQIFAVDTHVHEPKLGEVVRINFFVMDQRKDGMHAAAWSPPLVSDFHTLARFGKLKLGAPAKTAAPSKEGQDTASTKAEGANAGDDPKVTADKRKAKGDEKPKGKAKREDKPKGKAKGKRASDQKKARKDG